MLLKRSGSCYRCWYIWFTCYKDFIALKAEVNKLDIKKLVDFPTSLNNLKAKVDDIDVCKLKTVHVDTQTIKWCST